MSGSYLKVYENALGEDPSEVPSKKMPRGIILFELPMMGCTSEMKVTSHGYFTQIEIKTITIRNWAKKVGIDIIFNAKTVDVERFHKWSQCVQESEDMSKTNMSRLCIQRLDKIEQSRPKSVGSRTPEGARRMFICPDSFVAQERGN